MDYHQLPTEYRVDNEIAKRRVREISELMDKNLKLGIEFDFKF